MRAADYYIILRQTGSPRSVGVIKTLRDGQTAPPAARGRDYVIGITSYTTTSGSRRGSEPLHFSTFLHHWHYSTRQRGTGALFGPGRRGKCEIPVTVELEQLAGDKAAVAGGGDARGARAGVVPVVGGEINK